MITPEVFVHARKLWDYHRMGQTPQKVDCILALGTQDTRVANRAAELYHEGFAPLVVFSGGLGKITKDIWTQPEAERFAEIAISKGVPADVILIENKSTNTGENILFTQQLLAQKQLDPQSFIVVQKPYMERRCYATFKKQWPGKTFYVTSQNVSLDEYIVPEVPVELLINSMVGDLQRIKVYPEKGFQIHQDIPEEVWASYETLVAMGFDRFIIK